MNDNTARDLHLDHDDQPSEATTREQPQLNLVPQPPTPSRISPLAWVGIGGGLAVVVAAGVVAALYFAGNKKEAAYFSDMKATMGPVMEANDDVSAALLTLKGPEVAAAQAEVKDAKKAVGDAQSAVATIDPPGDVRQRQFAVSQALRENADYLDAVSAVLIAGAAGKPSPETVNLARLEEKAADLYDEAGPDVGASGYDLDGANALKTWADTRVKKAVAFAKKKTQATKNAARAQGRAQGRAEAERAASQYNLGRYSYSGYDIVVASGDINDVFAERMASSFKSNGFGSYPVESFKNPGSYVDVTCRPVASAYAECGFTMAEYNSILIFDY